MALAGALLPATARSRPEVAAPVRSRPNLVLLFTDDQNPDCIGYASGGKVLTPNLDRLAKQGTVFQAAYAGALPCAPSRGGLMTGLHYHRWKRNAVQRLVPGEWTWAHALRRAGYHTALLGKMHFAPMRADHGFEHAEYCEHRFSRVPRSAVDDYEHWLQDQGIARRTRHQDDAGLWALDPAYHPISWLRDRSIAYLDARRGDPEPFCLLVSFRHPHGPILPTERFASLYDPAALEIRRETWTAPEGISQRLTDAVARAPHIRSWEKTKHKDPEGLLRRLVHHTYASVSQIDDAVGTILEHVDPQSTLVFFTSDHGHYLGWQGLSSKEPYVPFEPVARVPFFALGAGVPRGATVRAPVSLLDLAPTFLAAAGVEVPPDLDGQALQPHFRDPAVDADRVVYCHGLSDFDGVRGGSFKYLRSQDGKDEMLFDLSADPDERTNLAPRAELAPIRERLAHEMDRVTARPTPHLPRFDS